MDTGSTMDGEGTHAKVLEHASDVEDDDSVLIPPEARFDRHGECSAFKDTSDNHFETVQVAQESGSVSAPGDFLHPASTVDVDEVSSGFLGDGSGAFHGFFSAAVDLDGDGTFAGGEFHLLGDAGNVSNEGLTADEFGVEEVSSVFFAEGAKGRIGDVFHGSEAQGPIYIDVSDAHDGSVSRRVGDGDSEGLGNHTAKLQYGIK